MATCDVRQMNDNGGLMDWMAVAAPVNHVKGILEGMSSISNSVINSRFNMSTENYVTSSVNSGSNESNSGVLVHGLVGAIRAVIGSGGEEGSKTRALLWLEDKRTGELVLRLLEYVAGLNLRNPSQITKDLPMVASPVPILTCIALYIVAVHVWSSHIKKSGLKARKEDPLPLHCLVVVHNLLLCVFSACIFVGLLASARRHGYSFWGNIYRGDEVEMGILLYAFYMSKLYEFMDTAIMLLRRNLRQLTGLHVYHHATITFVYWLICYTTPGADAYFSAAFNAGIHVMMYLYYLLAATVAKGEIKRRKYLFWGKYLTVMQMVQFLSFIGQSTFTMLRPETYPNGVPRFMLFYSASLLGFFAHFFVKKYGRAPKSAKGD